MAAQKYYIDKLMRQAAGAPAGRTRGLIKAAVPEEPVANAIFIQWLLEESRPAGHAQLAAINGALQKRYLKQLGRDAPGIDSATVAKLKRDGITMRWPRATAARTTSRNARRTECPFRCR